MCILYNVHEFNNTTMNDIPIHKTKKLGDSRYSVFIIVNTMDREHDIIIIYLFGWTFNIVLKVFNLYEKEDGTTNEKAN